MGRESSIHESFSIKDNVVVREVSAGKLESQASVTFEGSCSDPQHIWDTAVLKGRRPTFTFGNERSEIIIADVFCGAGGLCYGARDACSALGLVPRVAFGADQDLEALAVFSENLKPSMVAHRNISSLVDYVIDGQADSASFAYPPFLLDDSVAVWANGITVLMGGPPCQGHSSLNNRTRRADPRNLLYLSVPALAVALNVPAVIIENVPEVRQDKQSVFATAVSLLKSEGYTVDHLMMNATVLGVPQTRRRLFLVATKGKTLRLKEAYRACARPKRTLWFSVSDLEEVQNADIFDSKPNIDPVNQARIDYLFDHDLFELPNDMRPDCHKEGHSYPSVYGRLKMDQPAGTVTQGFNVIGRGRFIHPTQRRPITPHEAARLQGFPDCFKWQASDGQPLGRSAFAKLIGNAVPPPMGYAVMLAILDSLFPATNEVP
jgi:DNA (cytosine-5)-methyltransferase 1